MVLADMFGGIRGKLLLFGGFPILILGALTYISSTSISALSESIEVLGRDRIPATMAVANMTKSMSAAFRFAYRAHAGAGKPDLRQAAINNSRVQLKEFEEHYKAMGRLQLQPEIQELHKKIATLWKPILQMTVECLDLLENNETESDARALVHLFSNVGKPAGELTAALTKMEELENRRTADAIQNSSASSRKVQQFMLGACIGAIALILMASIFLATRLSRSMRTIALEISASGGDVSEASVQLNTASEQLSAGASEAAASLEETVASIEELSSMVAQNAENAAQANLISKTSRETAERGELEIKELISSISEMGKGAKKIEEIINVIDDIAFQTNLLALNAAVEAARAGDQGKGFAVVAEAVRALALRSAEAAKSITGLIKENVSRADIGTKAAAGSGIILTQIVNSAKQVADLNGEIASACREQSIGLTQISKAMNQLDQATQGNAASAEEVAASSGELSSQSNDLRAYVQRLRVVIDGKNVQEISKRERDSSAGARAA